MTDATRWDLLGCYRESGIATPHLDRLAASGTRFERGYTAQPVCAPARSALFTGTWPHSNGTWSNNLAPGLDVPTLGQRLRDRSVAAAYIGKWHLDGTDYFGNGRCPDGWDPAYWYDMRSYLEELSPEDRRASRDPATVEHPGVAAEFTYAHRCTQRALDFLADHEGDDFLLVVSYDEPHDPGITPPEFAARYRDFVFPDDDNVRDDLAGKPAHQRVWAGPGLAEDRSAYQRRDVRYFAAQEFVDQQIGRVLDAVDERAPGALVVYTSDHGDMLGSHRLHAKGPAMYDEIARVPLLARLPGVTAPGSVAPHPVSHLDVAPTVLTHLGLDVPDLLPGTPLQPVLADPSARVNDAVFVEFGRYEVDHDGFGGFQPMRGVFDGTYKLVVNLLSDDELYELTSDPGELHNLIDVPAHARRRDALHDRLLRWMNETRDPFRGGYWERRPWRADAREATWAHDGLTRQRPDDPGYEPRLLDYVTGLEMTETVRAKEPAPAASGTPVPGSGTAASRPGG
ncbi:sulfatase-like hydrolase/transferase [Streptomyces longispororuber]|uniref:sulfatase-like hydrolase/transferase n=1 Tax=Streptomyces longispororuber TaxID=68230 RepID=UPI00210C2D4B|nr:sulfatase-like hydrolase/transferase [Streptomyces longispororuber]MCQ4211486.1 sulfatase-like hydrolase/transferase [Streptomyces longispororuber]